VAVVVGCSEYHNVKNADGNRKFDDMPEAVDEAQFMIEQLKGFNYEVLSLINPSRIEMNELFDKKLKGIIKAGIKAKERTLVHFYYTGHGKMKEQTIAVLNEEDQKKSHFPIERKMRTFALFEYTCVYALLDCCREPFSKEENAPITKVVSRPN